MSITQPKPVVSAQLEPETRAELALLAHRSDRTISQEVRRAIVQHLKRERAYLDSDDESETTT